MSVMSSGFIDLTASDDEDDIVPTSSSASTAAVLPTQSSTVPNLAAKLQQLNTNGHDVSTPSAGTNASSRNAHSASVPTKETTAVVADQESQSSRSFSSFEIKSLSKSRLAKTRLPDLVQHDQNKGIHNPTHASAFIGYVQEHEEGHAGLEVINEVDNEHAPPMDFAYTDGFEISEGVKPATLKVHEGLTIPEGCDCEGDECDPSTCACQKLHEALAPNPWFVRGNYTERGLKGWVKSEMRGKFAYTESGRMRADLLSIPQTPIWECNSACGCSESCKNRKVQFGRHVKLVMKKTHDRGWGVFAGQDLPKGTFVMTYGGQLITSDMADERGRVYDKTGITYCLDNEHYHIFFHTLVHKWRAACRQDPSIIPNEIPREFFDERNDKNVKEMYVDAEGYDVVEHAIKWHGELLSYNIDAGLWGNLSRYFNHSCAPNLNSFPVYTEERDLLRPFMAFFTAVNVEQGEELCFDYNLGQSGAPEGQEAAELQIPVGNGTATLDSVMKSMPAGTEVRIADVNVAAQLAKGVSGAEPEPFKANKTLYSLRCRCGAPNCRGFVFR